MRHYVLRRIVACGLIVAFLGCACASAEEGAYTFFLNGKPIEPAHWSLSGDVSTIMPGDVICVDAGLGLGRVFVTLGQERVCRFVNPESESGGSLAGVDDADTLLRRGRLFLERADGRRQLVGVRVGTTTVRKQADPPQTETPGTAGTARRSSSFDTVTSNPLADMSPEDIGGLWGISVNSWPDGMTERLSHVDPQRVCITVDDSAGLGGRSVLLGGPMFPPIPSSVRYLSVTDSMSPGLRDFSHLEQFGDLVFLRFQGSSREPLEAGLISQNTSLRCLDVSNAQVDNYQKLAALTNLRYLNVSGCDNIDDIAFVAGMRQLKTLIIGRTPVASLSALDDSQSISWIHANMTRVSVLPKGELPSLRTLELVAANVNAEAVEQFRTSHPACVVRYGWTDMLREALDGTTRLRVRSGGTCHRRPAAEKTLAEVTQPAEIDRLIKGLAIDEGRSGGHCMCCGDPTFEFYAADRLLAMVGCHHGERLRWEGGQWPGDGELTDASRDFLISWLAEHGVEGPRQEVEANQRQRDESIRRQQRYAELIPPQILASVLQAGRSEEASLRKDTSGRTRFRVMAEAFIKHEQDPQTSVELYFKVFGVIKNEPWNVYGGYYDSIVAQHLLGRFEGAASARAALAVMGDEEGEMGTTRWFFGENGWRNLDERDRPRVLPRLAQRALGLDDRYARYKTMTVLGEISDEWAVQTLRRLLSRPEVEQAGLTPGNSGYAVDFGDGRKVQSAQCSDRVWAAFCLAKRGDRPSLPAIEKLADESTERAKELLQQAAELLRNKSSGGS
jgi:hypothetical protein